MVTSDEIFVEFFALYVAVKKRPSLGAKPWQEVEQSFRGLNCPLRFLVSAPHLFWPNSTTRIECSAQECEAMQLLSSVHRDPRP